MNETIPADGIYQGVSFTDYAAIPLLNCSALKWGLQSMRHVRACMDGKLHKGSASLAKGSALHLKLLEPELFHEQFALAGQCEAMTGHGKRCTKGGSARWDGKWFCATHARDTPPDDIATLTPAQWDEVHAAAEAVKADPVVALFRE
ncbi:MAG: hypothetical protein VKL39_24475, partial [Leptolyngbyaceae bacterium]|nr:hypothetical protein [Leptolyngbyaceae bacterium]